MIVIRSILLTTLLFQIGCTVHKVKKEPIQELLSCEEKAEPKSLQYLEQRYRCTSK